MTSRDSLEREAFGRSLDRVYRDTDRLFFWLLLAQWAFAIGLALVVSPYTWEGSVRGINVHVPVAVLLGGVINALPLVLLRTCPGWWLTRHSVTVAQMLWSGLLIHLTGGRIETHFHVFGSLAFLAFYRDWRLLPTATVTVSVDHLARGLVWPESMYGIANPEWWRFLEHASWVAFEDIVLLLGCLRATADMKVSARREVALTLLHADVEAQVRNRMTELVLANQALACEMRRRLLVEAELRQAQKLESVGRLASGVAHEINTPVQFVSDSIHFVRDAANDMKDVIEKLQAVRQAVVHGETASAAAAVAAEAEESADLPYLLENVPKALDRSLDGLSRVATIVRSMKEFAHPDQKEKALVDLNQAIESTLVIARNEYKYVADLETDFGELPRVLCHAGEINQVLLNILVNAAHSIGDVVEGTEQRGTIRVQSWLEDGHAVITIEDSGRGIPDAIRDKIFDPFFTTKEPGKGTGQGLAIARSIVVDKHGGQLGFETEPGKGTKFRIRLPVTDDSAHAAPTGAPTGVAA